jgi:hypothetical protein
MIVVDLVFVEDPELWVGVDVESFSQMVLSGAIDFGQGDAMILQFDSCCFELGH